MQAQQFLDILMFSQIMSAAAGTALDVHNADMPVHLLSLSA
jgi:hypothetical protein